MIVQFKNSNYKEPVVKLPGQSSTCLPQQTARRTVTGLQDFLILDIRKSQSSFLCTFWAVMCTRLAELLK